MLRKVDPRHADEESVKVFYKALLDMFEVKGPTLDMFARDGALTVQAYESRIDGDLDLWELDGRHEKSLQEFTPNSVKIGCSYSLMNVATQQYEMIVVDTPQGIHHDVYGNEHVEHFTVVKSVGKLLADKSILVLYVNKRPYDQTEIGSHGMDEYDEFDFSKWMRGRQEFYGANPQALTESEALRAYCRELLYQGLEVTSTIITPSLPDVPGEPPYAFYLGLILERKNP